MYDPLNVFLVFAGVKEDGFESRSLALEDVLTAVVQAHYCLDNPHPRLNVILELGVQVLVVQVVKYFHQHFQHHHIIRTLGILLHPLQDVKREVQQEVVELVADLNDFLVKGV